MSSSAWKPESTTPSPSRSGSANCSPASAPTCGGRLSFRRARGRRIVTLAVVAAVLAITLFGVPLGYAVSSATTTATTTASP